MKSIRNTSEFQRPGDVSSIFKNLKQWARRNMTKEKVAKIGVASAATVAISYLGSTLYLGLQNYSVFAY